MRQRRAGNNAGGFTLVELMVVLLVIGVLLTLLLPALNMVKNGTQRVRQKAQFHTIEVGLEGYRSEFGDYPPSYGPYPALTGAQPEVYYYYGAQRLAEALMGRDGFGFHPKSQFRRDGLGDMNGDGVINNDETVYHAGTDLAIGAFTETSQQNLKARKGPYVELENANAIRLEAYGTLYTGFDPTGETYVFADQFRIIKSVLDSKRIGMPILYYKANTSNFDHTSTGAITQPTDNVYMATDNLDFYNYGTHPMAAGLAGWFDKTRNPAFPMTPYPRPYRHDSFILHSAGPDGLYGSEDDIFNFDASE